MKYCSYTDIQISTMYLFCKYNCIPTSQYFKAQGLFSSEAMVYKILYKEVNMYDHLCQI